MTRRTVLVFISDRKLRNALEALILSEKIDCRIHLARNVEEVEKVLIDYAEGIIVIDCAELEEDLASLLARIRFEGWRSLVLVDGFRDQTRMQLAGADVALVKGYPASDLIETVKALLQSYSHEGGMKP